MYTIIQNVSLKRQSAWENIQLFPLNLRRLYGLTVDALNKEQKHTLKDTGFDYSVSPRGHFPPSTARRR